MHDVLLGFMRQSWAWSRSRLGSKLGFDLGLVVES